jgi:hypothetical protein
MSLIPRLLREPAGGFVHPVDAIERLFARTVSVPLLEESDACGRLIVVSLCIPPARLPCFV